MGVHAALAALPCLLKERIKQESYQIYVTDCLQAISQNSMNHIVPGISEVIEVGRYQKERWNDVMNPKPKETRTGEEIAANVIQKCGLKVVN